MAAFIGVFLVSLAAVIAIGSAINYFFRLGIWPALGYAAIAVCAFLLFCASGIWADAQRDDWGSLTPIFALLLLACFLAIKFGRKLWAWWQRKLNNILSGK